MREAPHKSRLSDFFAPDREALQWRSDLAGGSAPGVKRYSGGRKLCKNRCGDGSGHEKGSECDEDFHDKLRVKLSAPSEHPTFAPRSHRNYTSLAQSFVKIAALRGIRRVRGQRANLRCSSPSRPGRFKSSEEIPGAALARSKSRSASLSVEGVNPGAYELVVGGSVRGTLNVAADGGGTGGQLEYETGPQNGALLLDFAVAGQEIIIRQGATAFFRRVFPTP